MPSSEMKQEDLNEMNMYLVLKFIAREREAIQEEVESMLD